MAAVQKDDSVPSLRFKRRKIAHPKRVFRDDDVPTVSSTLSPDVATPTDAAASPKATIDEEETVPNLKEILRNRRRPRDRLKEAARKADAPRAQLVPVEALRQDQYTNRFVAQTGQVIDRDDKQMTEYVEARTAEKNFRQYGWPIPTHLQAAVAAIAPDLRSTFTTTSTVKGTSTDADTPTNMEQSNRLAAGQGKLQEVDLGPDATMRIEKAWRRIDNPDEESLGTAQKEKYGYARRRPKRRNSADLRRDEMVEAVLREAKLEYFDDSTPANPFSGSSTNNDDALAEQFRAEYFESMEDARQQRKPAPPAGGIKGAKEAPKGPKLGGSKSARAKILKAQEEEKKGIGKR